MAIARRPKKDEQAQTVDVEALIAKGGSVGGSANEAIQPPEDKVGVFTLRVPGELLTALDTLRKSKPVKISRQQWILEAIVQRLEKDSPN